MLKDWLPLFRLRPHWLVMMSCAIALSASPRLSYGVILAAFAYLTATYGELANFLYDYPTDMQNPRMKNYAHIKGRLKISSLGKATNIFLSMSLFAGVLLLTIKSDVFLLILLIFAIHCAYSYSVPPLRLKRYWWGGVVSYTAYAAVIFLMSAAIFAADMATAGMLALAFWIGSLSVWTLNGIPDEEYDTREGIETLAIKFGPVSCIRAYLPLALFSSTVSAAMIIDSAGSLYAGVPFLVPVAIGTTAYFRMKRQATSKITESTLYLAKLPYRYNLALVTLAYFIIRNT